MSSPSNILQVEETKQKQRDGLKTILAKHYTQDKMEKCFLKDPEELKPELNTSDTPQEETIRRNIEALLEFTTPSPTTLHQGLLLQLQL